MASETHEIVVLGANFAGLNITHYLQRQVFPVLQRLDSGLSYHITLVSPNTHFFFKVAAPRALVDPKQIPAIFKPIADGLKQYGSSVTFVRAKATGLDAASKTVTVEEVEGGKKDIKYDSLFICTGYTSAEPLWSIHDDHETTIQALNKTHELLPKVKTVLIAGGGPVGVETAGEIAANYPNAKITLVSAGPVLEQTKPSVSQKALKLLRNAKVEVITGVRVNETSSSGEETTVQLGDGSSKTTDLFIDARGVDKVNNEFLPKSWLDSTGRVTTKDGYFRVKGDGQADTSGIYVLGDIVAGSTKTAIELDPQVATAASSFAVDVASKRGKSTKSSGGPLSFIGLGSKGVSQKEFKPMKDTIMVPIGPTGGVGQLMGFGLPNIMVKKAKAEKFFVEMVEPAVSGSKYAKV